MEYQVGDRVRNLIDDKPGIKKGETGTIVRLRGRNTPLIRWDEYNDHRHQYNGEVELGHGWHIYTLSQIELIPPDDLGEFDCSHQTDALMELFQL